jgi:epoxyqueuosine reductase QueG
VEACPHSQPRESATRVQPNPAYQASHSDFDLADVLSWSEQSRASMKLSKALRRAKLSMWKRNALLIVAGTNAATWSDQLVSALKQLASDEGGDVWLREKSAELLRRCSGA